MKFLSRLSVLIILLLSSFSLAGEIPIQVGPNKDSGPTIAYNSVDDEYLVVWTETSATISSEIMGQRIKADGTGNIGSAFTIFSIGAYPSVAYNSQTNEYIVTESLLGNIIGRRVSNVGTLIGSPVTYMSKNISIWSKIIYNSLGNNYLLVAAELFDLGNDQSSIKISTRKITSEGQLTGTENLIREQGHGNYSDGARFSVAYAPITSATTPSGRYLLAIKDPTDLTMLDDNGVIVSKVYDPQQPGLVVDDHVPFQASKVGIPYNVDVAFGNWEGQEAFMVVWGDRDQTVNNQQWTGIWAGIVDAAPVEYNSGSVNTTVFPVSAIPNHNITPEYSKTWKPAVTYNKISYKFMVAWRETPTTDPLNDTKVNHIRANSVATAITPANVVLSSTTGNENPKNPAIAASTKNSNSLVVWEDSRNLATTDVDLYGNILNTTPAKVFILTSPNGSEVWQAGTQQKIVWESSDVGDFDVTIEYSIDNGATYNFIAFQTNIDGVNTFDWTVPNSPSTQCLVKISASVFSDTSDNFFTITPQETPKITVISPNGGEIWEVGSQQEIKWDLSNEIDSVFIDINYFGIGSLKVNSIEKTLNDGSFIWTVTDWWSTDSVDCRISVSYSIGNNYYRDESDTFFTIIKSKPKITVISPNGGENWIDKGQHEIKWTSTGFSGNVRIDLLYHGANDTGYFNIALNELNDGSFNWNLDISQLPIQSNPQGFNCLIRVSDATKNPPGVGPDDGKIFDWSNTYFTFKPKTPKITVVSPNGGEIWTVGEQREIKWTSENFTDSVNIVLTTFYQVSISGVIAQNVPNTGSYFWTVKTGITDTVKALIRVEEAKIMATILDESDAFFTIIDTTAKITVISPNGGEEWALGEQHEIKWNSNNFNGQIRIDLEYTLPIIGTLHYNITNNEANDGSFSWTIDESNITLAGLVAPGKIRVADASKNSPGELEDGKIFDWSDNFFDLSPFRTSKIKVISPNGGEVWTEGEQHEIKWTSQNISGNVNIYFHGQYWIGNSAWEELIEINDFIANTSNTGSFIWTIPDYIYIYGNCVIRVHDASDPEIFDQSDSFISCPPKPNTYNGNNVTLDLGDGTNINFDKVDSAGITYQFIGDIGSSPPSGNEIFPSNSPKHYYIETTSTFSGNIQLCFAYSDSGLTEVDESNLQLNVYDTTLSQWVDITTSLDKTNNIICGEVSHLSEFAIMMPTSDPHDYFVTNTNDSGDGSFRKAIDDANSNASADKILFNIPKTDPNYDATKGVWLISPSVSLPHILDSNLIVDGTSQRLFIGEDTNPDGPELVIDGNNSVNRCLEVNRRGIEIYELTIKNFNFQGIFINSTEDCIISGCYIGTNYNGMESAGMNAGIGVINSSNILIGPSPFLNKANLISGNRYFGISLSDSSQNNIIAGNVIGLNRNLSATFGKSGLGIDFSYSPNNRIEDNLIGGNNIGISFGGSDLNIVKNNFIGTDSSWVDFGNNDGIAIWSNASGNKIIENFIGYNKRLGIRVDSSNSIQNYISRNKISRNMGAGIENRYGGNTELDPPIINSVSENQISGTASPNQIIELFADSSNEGQIFIDSTITNESGNFSISISKLPNLPNITATARDLLGNTSEFSSPFVITDIEETENKIATEYALYQNYPNPFNPTTVINWQLPVSGHTTLKVYDMLGNEIETLIDKQQSPGNYKITFNAKNLSSGVYFYMLKTETNLLTKKMLLLK